ncbi:ribosomal protein L13e-domain-containing protein [Immersiella caudata]|uniref:60S ribosomal protein L13 n=1 Tax=Immersiella caudata TaxID=314043 RepID=A0AA39WJW3_9PEZI|nr:ribosomal protein L13e-domain-containing protein [Immersiella caudata]
MVSLVFDRCCVAPLSAARITPSSSGHAEPQDGDPQPNITLHPLPTHDGLIVSIRPPRAPAEPLEHVPCDIVLVIDVSGSMASEAPVPGNPGETKEKYGLSVLDLTKHAANTILETLNANDRLGIVTFAGEAKVLQSLMPMTASNKRSTKKKIEGMAPKDITNLWGGIQSGLGLFDKEPNGKVPALMVLTDGMPNHMCPSMGYVHKLRSMGQLPATLHTFGFGFSLRSGLLKSIAEIGGGNYSFIPDAGMIGTIFVHAVANLQSTYANNVLLRLQYPAYLGLEETTGEAVDKRKPIEIEGTGPQATTTELRIPLSTLQYGHPRDILLHYRPDIQESLQSGLKEEAPPVITAVLEYQRLTSATDEVAIPPQNILDTTTTLAPAEIAYHQSRSALIAYLSSLYPLRPDEEHQHLHQLPPDTSSNFETFLSFLPASAPEFTSDPHCQSLLQDICGPMRTGQVALALSSDGYYTRWGKHYLPSLAGAHARQICNSFKDPGPLMYGRESPLFVACRDRLDAAFDALEAPKPSRKTQHRGKVKMSRYNRSSNPCFAGCETVVLARGEVVRIGKLRAGMKVLTPRGARKVVAVLRTMVRQERMCVVGEEEVLVTPYHPVRTGSGEAWVFPKDVARREVRYTGSIYSVLLERDTDVDAHAIMVGGVWGVTLGHGKMGVGNGDGDVRAHQFLGDYDRVIKSLARLHVSRNFRKDWQRRVRCHFDQPGKKASRRIARRAKAAAVAPRPVDKLRPVVRCPTVKYNRRTRLGRGFSLAELKAAGIPKLYAPTIGIAVDARRQNLSEEGLAANVERLKQYKARLIVFPKRSNKAKKADTPAGERSGETTQSIASVFGIEQPIAAGFSEIKKSNLPKSTDAYKSLRKARSDAKLVGVREKRAKDKADAEAAKK